MKFANKERTDIVNSNVPQVNLVTMEPIQTKPLIHSPLLTIEVDVGSETKKIRAKAIVDSGLEINIVCQELAHEINKLYPITPLKEIHCSDANGNLGLLLGQFSNVRLMQGAITTNAVFFVGSQKISFQLLLGQPWLQGNLISISERLEGTYLVYHDPQDTQNYKELFVLEENWKKEANKMAVMHLVKTKEINNVGAWKIEARQEIVILSEPKGYLLYMLILERGEDDRLGSKRLETPSPMQHQTSDPEIGIQIERPANHRDHSPDMSAARKN